MKKKLLIVIALFSLFGFSYSQKQEPMPAHVAPSWTVPDLITDRPDQTESSVTVPHNSLQIETGFIFERFMHSDYTFDNWGIATTLFRYGLLKNMELRLASNYQYSELKTTGSNMDTIQQGMGPILAGVKIYITEEHGAWPELALLADITLNVVGDLDYRPTNSYTTIKFAASHTLSKVFGLGYNFGIANNGEVAKGFFVYSVVLGASITERLSAFAEVYGNFDDSQYPRTRLDGGLTFLLRPNLQLDLSGGFGPNDVQSMWFSSIGLTWRIPR